MDRMREGMIGAEPASAELERRYRESLRGLLERRLSPAQRGAAVFALAIGAVMTVVFVAQLVRIGPHARAVQVAGLVVGLLFSAGWAALAVASLRSGLENLRFHSVLRSYLVVGFVTLLMGVMLWAGLSSPDVERGNQLILYGLAFLVAFGIPYLTAQLVRQSELRLRQDVLRVQLALAQVQERLNRTE